MEPQNTETTHAMHALHAEEKPEKPEECFFCYSKFTDRRPKVTENHIGCTCRFPIHQKCWERWNILECPICHSRVEEEQEEEDQDDQDDEELELVLEPRIQPLRDNELLIIIPYINRQFIVRNNLPHINFVVFILFIVFWVYSYLLR